MSKAGCLYDNSPMEYLLFVCEHKKIDGQNEISIDIRHYLKSLNKKPGALRNFLTLKSIPRLKTIYDKIYTEDSRWIKKILRFS